MITDFFNSKRQIALAMVFGLLISPAIYAGPTETFERLDRDLEDWYLSLLAEVQNNQASDLKPFTTDGCSGGLSEGWKSFASIIPKFKDEFGEQPPWESCCVEHDRAYWKGEVIDGYDKRLAADKLLRQCVIDYGEKNSARLAQDFSMDEKTVQQQFTYAGELMYRAVRLGGKPCSLLPWRWGYGWPHCKVLPVSAQE